MKSTEPWNRRVRTAASILACYLFFCLIPVFQPFHARATVPLDYSREGTGFDSRWAAADLPVPEHDLSRPWFVMEGEHFRVIFPEAFDENARLVLAEAEKLLPMLAQWSGVVPGRRIDIVLSDASDYANGSVSIGPRGFYVTLFIVHPFNSIATGLDFQGEWYRSLLIHELAHLVHLDQVSGLFSVGRSIFGSVVHPNTWTPLFYREGFATYAETVLAEGGTQPEESGGSLPLGRGNSPFTEMYLRTSVEERSFLPLDRASNSAEAWPGPQGHYLFGVSFLNYLADRYGEEKILAFNRRSGAYPAYLWNGPFRKTFEAGMASAWNGFRTVEERGQGAALEEIAAGGRISKDVSPVKPLGGESGYVYSFCFDPAGDRLFYSMRPPGSTGGLYVHEFDTGRERRLKKGVYAQNLTVAGDGRRLYYLRNRIERNVNLRSELYSYDLRARRERRVSRGGGIQDFALLGEKGPFLLCRSVPNGVALSEMDMQGGILNLLTTPVMRDEAGDPFDVIEDPEISPDGRLAAFSCRTARGRRGIYVISLADLRDGLNGFKRVTNPRLCAYNPQWISDERLICVSDEGGVYNLLGVDTVTGEQWPVTGVSTGVFEPVVSRDGKIAVKEYTAEGFRISLCGLSGMAEGTGGATSVNRLRGPETPGSESGAPAGDGKGRPAEEETPGAKSAYPRYRPGGWILPGSWLPFVAQVGTGFGPGVWTWGGDLLKRHTYELRLFYDLIDRRAEYRADYLYSARPLSYFVSLSVRDASSPAVFGPEAAFFPGVRFVSRHERFSIRADLGCIIEDPYTGPYLLAGFSSLKAPRRWLGPERGFAVSQEVFGNLEGENFVILGEALSAAIPLPGSWILRLEALGRAGIGGPPGLVFSGASDRYDYLPLDGIYTAGYPDPVPGDGVLNLKAQLWVPVFTTDRGFRAFPLFLQGVALGGYVCGGVLFSNRESLPLMQRPGKYLRTSLGVELKAGLLAGYEFPVELLGGYQWAFSEGGRDGFYWAVKIDRYF